MKIAKMKLIGVAVSLSLLSCAALADKGGGHGRQKYGEDDPRYDQGAGATVEFRFGSNDRNAVHEYYAGPRQARNCPPGLAKKGNGCMPPGQAKKWMVGRPLPYDVVRYDLPPALLYRLPPPPSGHRYVRVGADILMIAIGSAMVVDAIQDIAH